VLGLDVSLLSLLEVDNVPDGIEIIRLDILVLQVKGMLPNINSNDGLVGEERVLVSGSDDLELLGRFVVPEPAPATTLNTSGNGVHLLFEVLNAAKVSDQGLLQRTVWELSAILLGW